MGVGSVDGSILLQLAEMRRCDGCHHCSFCPSMLPDVTQELAHSEASFRQEHDWNLTSRELLQEWPVESRDRLASLKRRNVIIITQTQSYVTPASSMLKWGGRGTSTRMSARLRNSIAVTEIALATILLVGAGLFIRTLANLGRVPLGFAPQGVITFQLAPPQDRYPTTGKAQHFYSALVGSLQSLPGVRAAAVSSGVPFGAGNYTTHPMFTIGSSVLPPETRAH
ncbi:MAG: hypothetical protein JO145_06720 [Acidobacteriaceae bacterium]|nr:hypothetical protein [Acidobacteriaceae bacterium]